MTSARRAFVIMPFGEKKAPDGTVIDFNGVYKDLLVPAIEAAGLMPHRADADRRGGSIHLDMFQDLLLAEFAVADLTLDNPNVWYEIGVRHALRAGGSVLVYAMRDRLPFDIAGQRMQRYTLKGGRLDPEVVATDRAALKDAIDATLGAWRGRRASPVYQQLPNLREPDWKTLKVGDVNDFWQALEAWESRIEVARRKQRPGDILVLAEETPNSVLEFEALRIAARALIRLNRSRYALNILERASRLEPDDLEARQLEGIALGRAQRYPEARECLRRLADEYKDGETMGLLARTWKDEWMQVWNAHPQRNQDPVAAARDTAATLQSAASAYIEAFRAAPGDYYPAINALTLGRLWEHVTGRRSRLPLDRIAAGVAWTAAAAAERNKDYWSLATRAELALIEERQDDAIDDYSEAAALAVANRDWFALDSSGQQLAFLGELKFHSEIVTEAAAVIDRAEQQVRALIGSRPEERVEPDRVVVFSGHMIDNPADRGEGQAKPPRFPPSKVPAAGARIRAALDEIGAGAGDLALCGGASGGDLLFAEACLDRGMRLELHLARAENEFLAESVTFADPDRRWERSFTRAKEKGTVLVMPEELGQPPEGVSAHDRCNRWMVYTAMSHGLSKISFIALWDGAPGDGPGGTENMVELVRQLTGRQPILIDPATL
jgi:tetratricopeptide (TPR) repeat protein